MNEVYDPLNDTWTTKASMLTGTSFCASAVANDKIYVLGGGGNANQMYDPQTDKWVNKASLPVALSGSASTTSGAIAPERIYVFGWGNANEIYDAKTDSWTSGAPVPISREGFGVACVNDQFYVIGGETLNWEYSLYRGTTGYNNNEQYTPVGYGTIPPKISLLSPLSQTYNESSFPLVFSTNRPANWTGYSLDEHQNITVDGNDTVANLTNGWHTLRVYSNDTFGNMASSQKINFTVAVLPPPEHSEPLPTAAIAVSGAIVVIAVAASMSLYYKKRKAGKSDG